MKPFHIRPLQADDRGWIGHLLSEWWCSTKIVTRGRLHHADQLPGFIALHEGNRVGLVTYRLEGSECEIITLNSLIGEMGIGSALIEAVREVAISSRCERLWLITTNDNLSALRFYQKQGFVLVAVYRNALEQSRRLKPEIPLLGMEAIPLRDEIELEFSLSSDRSPG
jgi:DNA-3-methyladenine glycosylase I